MKVLVKGLAVLVALTLLAFGSVYVASELGGEVVVLHRQLPDGSISPVRVWIVDDNGHSWIEHGDRTAHWMSLLGSEPRLTLERDGLSVEYAAQSDPAGHARYHQLRAQKYGWADAYIAMFSGDAAKCEAIPVMLQTLLASRSAEQG